MQARAREKVDMMTVAAAPQRSSVSARRFGYTVAICINAALLYLVNVSPGWQAVPFLTDEMPQALGWVNASIVAGIVANSLYVLVDRPRFRAFGELAVTLVGLAALVRLWQVFPFAFDSDGVPWSTVVRWVLAVGMVGSVIAVIVNLVRVPDTTERA
jgi:hypothetical protein